MTVRELFSPFIVEEKYADMELKTYLTTLVDLYNNNLENDAKIECEIDLYEHLKNLAYSGKIYIKVEFPDKEDFFLRHGERLYRLYRGLVSPDVREGAMFSMIYYVENLIIPNL